MLKKEIRRLRVYYEDWGSHGCVFGNVCAEHKGGEESHMGCGLQGVLRGVMVKSHGGHQCLWCDMHHERGDGHDGQRKQELTVEPSICHLTAEQARNGHTNHFTKDVIIVVTRRVDLQNPPFRAQWADRGMAAPTRGYQQPRSLHSQSVPDHPQL